MKRLQAITVLDLLGLIFITLKLIGTIDWSWLWVLTPFWFALLVEGALVGWHLSRKFKDYD